METKVPRKAALANQKKSQSSDDNPRLPEWAGGMEQRKKERGIGAGAGGGGSSDEGR